MPVTILQPHRLMKLFLSAVLVVGFFIFSVHSVAAAVFTEHPNNPVFSYSNVPNTFDRNQIRNSNVIHTGTEFRMYYAGLNDWNVMSIGLATSPDGISWTRHSSEPVFYCGENELTINCGQNVNWSSHGVFAPNVMYDEEMYKMWYIGDSVNGPSQNKVGYATSPDGVNWTPFTQNPVFPTAQLGTLADNAFSMAGVTKLDDTYYMYYKKDTGIAPTYVATSSDGVSWFVANNGQSVMPSGIRYLGTHNGVVYITQSENNDLYTTSDGVNFELVVTDLTGDALEIGSLFFNNDTVMMWRNQGIGNVEWCCGNIVVDLWTAPASMLGIGNETPILNPISDQTIDEGEALEFMVSATDPDGDNLTYNASNLPSGSVFDPDTQTFSWTPGYDDAGVYENVEFIVTDDGEPAASSSTTMTITVHDVPTLTEKIDALIEVVNGPDVPFLGKILMSAHLKNVKKSVEDEKYEQAKKQMQLFIGGVNLAHTLGRISEAVRDDLIAQANEIILDLDVILNGDNEVPLITQVDPQWAADPYADGDASCGPDIKACGCVISSFSMLGQYHDLETADGSEANPENMNSWLIEHGGYDQTGSIFWAAAQQYLGTEQNGTWYSHLVEDAHYANVDEAKAAVEAGKIIMANSPSDDDGRHFYLVTNKQGDKYGVRDPYWYETETLNDTVDSVNIRDYNNEFTSAHIYSYSADLEEIPGALEIHLNSPAELVLIDSEGRKLGYDPRTDEEFADIPGGHYAYESTYSTSDATSTGSSQHVTKVLYVKNPGTEAYMLQVIGTDDGDYDLAVYKRAVGAMGESEFTTDETTEGEVDEYEIAVGEGSGVTEILTELRELAEDLRKGDKVKLLVGLKLVEEAYERERYGVAKVLTAGLITYVEQHDDMEHAEEILELLNELKGLL